MGLLRDGTDDFADFAIGADGVGEGAGADACEGTGGGTGEDGSYTGGGGNLIVAAGTGGCGKASFLRIITSKSCCFNCSSTISLESTSLKSS